MTIHRLKLKDLDSEYIQKLRSAQKDDNEEIVIWIPDTANMMDDELFWKIIALLDWEEKSNNDIVKKAIRFLQQLSIHEIKAFENRLSKKLYLLDGLKYAQNTGNNAYLGKDAPFSVDTFLYARCAVVAQGEKIFESVLSKPETMVKDQAFEPLLSLSSRAYKQKTGEEFDYIPSYIYETFANANAWDGNSLLENILK